MMHPQLHDHEKDPQKTEQEPWAVSEQELIARSIRNYEVHDAFPRSGKIEATADDTADDATGKKKRVFANFQEACNHYNYPGSHRTGSVFNETGVIRTHSNSTPGKDLILRGGHEIHYRLKNDSIKSKFSLNMLHHQPVRFFRKVQVHVQVVIENMGNNNNNNNNNRRTRRELRNGCKDMGAFEVRGFSHDEAFVRLVEVGCEYGDTPDEGRGRGEGGGEGVSAGVGAGVGVGVGDTREVL